MDRRIRKTIFLVPAFAGAVFAVQCEGCEGLKCVGCALSDMCTELTGVLPIMSMLLVIGAGIVYSAGQLMGAETRARANVWATTMIVGAIIGILIVVAAPPIINTLGAGDLNCGYIIK
ncbi:hypothetical protein COU37_05120 [Candidatus Micrarchaeota archaeon CG10_big_fil_rev_8_21_14_0_10_45_29]|nr:MAG: hypothetical protein COU37_05120 [Candidatus Micrarchaeota archaeon CG10_big_fil_rev_8_21_14_0_10_45_29]